ncbi:chain-length determining protein [uncultured Anaerococcus sp.]|uniref:chain-length determining protein n=1 Tax=Anaerococcus sp. AH8042_DFU013_CI05 TaxID=3385202 RepID=UPI0025E01D44|nr:chain-length determining protein [uncultured Anaerococcus sp.]
MENKKSLFSAIPSAIIAGIIIGMITYFGLNFGGYKEYQAQSKVVTTNIENLNEASGTAATYAATINSPKIKQRTLETLGIDWNVGKLDSKLEIKPIENTSIIDIVVTDTNKLRAEDIADQYADYTVRVINNIYNSGAKVMEYSYGSATTIDNTLRYALMTGGIGFILWTVLRMIMINSYNNKIAKNYTNDKNETSEVREVREVEEKPAKKTFRSSKKEATKKASKVDSTSFESGSTKVIDGSEVKKAADLSETSSSKYEVLGRIPSYDKGELDV